MATRGASSRQSAVKAKVVLLGEGAVGKTSIVLRYFENKFNDKHEQTLQVGMEYMNESSGAKWYLFYNKLVLGYG